MTVKYSPATRHVNIDSDAQSSFVFGLEVDHLQPKLRLHVQGDHVTIADGTRIALHVDDTVRLTRVALRFPAEIRIGETVAHVFVQRLEHDGTLQPLELDPVARQWIATPEIPAPASGGGSAPYQGQWHTLTVITPYEQRPSELRGPYFMGFVVGLTRPKT